METTELIVRDLDSEIFRDLKYLECISLAMNSRGKNMRFGSIIEKEGEVIGAGWNRKPSSSSVIKMGRANHAEADAMNSAIDNGFDLSDSKIYVAGFFSEGSLYIPRKRIYTCHLCPPYMTDYGIKSVSIPMEHGWEELSIEEATLTSSEFRGISGSSDNKRRTLGQSKKSLQDPVLQ